MKRKFYERLRFGKENLVNSEDLTTLIGILLSRIELFVKVEIFDFDEYDDDQNNFSSKQHRLIEFSCNREHRHLVDFILKFLCHLKTEISFVIHLDRI